MRKGSGGERGGRDVLARGEVGGDLDAVDSAVVDEPSGYEPLAGLIFALFPQLDPGVVARGVL